VFVVQFDAKHRAGQHGCDTTFEFNVFFFGWLAHGGQKRIKLKKAGFGSPEPRPEIPTN
jgi:hypothetical protein